MTAPVEVDATKASPGSLDDIGREDDELIAALAHLQHSLDRRTPVTRRIRHLWATAKACRDLGPAHAVKAKFIKLANESGDVEDLGRHGREDTDHVLTWALRGWNPFDKGPLT
jgi:hypothetical protein